MTRERIEDMREVVLPFVKKRLLETNYENLGESDAEMFAKDFNEILNLAIKALDQESQKFKWCTGCREYDQEKHCCHRWSKFIRDTVEEMKKEQEPKPMVEIDLYSVIKQKYIEREVLDKIRVEIEQYQSDAFYSDDVMMNKRTVLEILDKYKVDRSEEE